MIHTEANRTEVMNSSASHAERRAVRLRVRAGMTDEVIRWLGEIADNPVDALEGLAGQGILSELFFLERNHDADYLLYIARANHVDEAERRFEASGRWFDVNARRFWDSHIRNDDTLELLADFVVQRNRRDVGGDVNRPAGRLRRQGAK